MRAGIDGRLHMLHRLVELYVLAATGKRVNQRSGMFLLSNQPEPPLSGTLIGNTFNVYAQT